MAFRRRNQKDGVFLEIQQKLSFWNQVICLSFEFLSFISRIWSKIELNISCKTRVNAIEWIDLILCQVHFEL